MRVILTEAEILMAIEDFILDTVKVPDDIRVDIDLKATRGDQGYTAEVDLVPSTSPADGSDRSVDDRIEASDTAVSEGLDIVGKVQAAKDAAKAPRRRGRPAGSKNLPKATVSNDLVDAAQEAKNLDEPVQVTTHPANEDANQEAPVDNPEPVQEAVSEPVPETVPETLTEATEVSPEVVAEAPTTPVTPEADPDPVPAADVPATDMSTQTQNKRSLFDNTSDAGDPEPAPNTEEALAAEAVATEPVEDEEEEDYTPTPETSTLPSEDAPAPSTTRSLFADLTKPQN